MAAFSAGRRCYVFVGLCDLKDPMNLFAVGSGAASLSRRPRICLFMSFEIVKSVPLHHLITLSCPEILNHHLTYQRRE